MNILIVSAHDNANSLTAACMNTALGVLGRAGHAIETTELYSQQFNPVATNLDFQTTSGVGANYMFEQQRANNIGGGFSPDIAHEMEKVKTANLIIFHFPLWWGSTPAILKGWFERVFAMGFAWNSGERFDSGLLKGKKALTCVIVGDPESYYSEEGMHNQTVEQHLYSLLHGTLSFCGMDVLKPFVIHNVTAASKQDLELKVDEYRRLLESIDSYGEYLFK